MGSPQQIGPFLAQANPQLCRPDQVGDENGRRLGFRHVPASLGLSRILPWVVTTPWGAALGRQVESDQPRRYLRCTKAMTGRADHPNMRVTSPLIVPENRPHPCYIARGPVTHHPSAIRAALDHSLAGPCLVPVWTGRSDSIVQVRRADWISGGANKESEVHPFIDSSFLNRCDFGPLATTLLKPHGSIS